jgi:RNA polymerase sigma-70 factor (ECF subfamily)
MQFLTTSKHSIMQDKNPGVMDDSVLVEQILKGDTKAFGELVNRYWAMAFHLCYQWTRNKQDAEEITQDAFVKVHKYLKRLKNKTQFARWFYQLVLQLIHENYRSRKSHKTLPLEEKITGASNSELDELDKLAIYDMLNLLSDKERLVLTLRFYRGLSCDEIAQHLNEPIGTITSRLFRAYEKLREKLK